MVAFKLDERRFDDPREQLQAFLAATGQFLGELTMEHPSYWPEELHASMRGAWERVGARVQMAIEQVGEVEIWSLEGEGLTGAELDYKVAVVRWAGGWWNRIREVRLPRPRVLRRFLKILDNLLDSIGQVVPGVSAIIEFKDMAADSATGDEGAPLLDD